MPNSVVLLRPCGLRLRPTPKRANAIAPPPAPALESASPTLAESARLMRVTHRPCPQWAPQVGHIS